MTSYGVRRLQANVSFGAATANKTFDNAAGLSGAISLVSVAGTSGAFVGGAETGSPGATITPDQLVLTGSIPKDSSPWPRARSGCRMSMARPATWRSQPRHPLTR